jgi:hypothetical protein
VESFKLIKKVKFKSIEKKYKRNGSQKMTNDDHFIDKLVKDCTNYKHVTLKLAIKWQKKWVVGKKK